MKKAREERELVQKLKEKGVHRNERSVSKLRSKSPYKGAQQSIMSNITEVKQDSQRKKPKNIKRP